PRPPSVRALRHQSHGDVTVCNHAAKTPPAVYNRDCAAFAFNHHPGGTFDAVIRIDTHNVPRHEVTHTNFIRPARLAESLPVVTLFVHPPASSPPPIRSLATDPGAHLTPGAINEAAIFSPPPVAFQPPFIQPAAVSVWTVITARAAPAGAAVTVI